MKASPSGTGVKRIIPNSEGVAMTAPTITINMDKKCSECGKPGASDSGICLSCATKAITGRVMKSQAGKAVAARFKSFKRQQGSTER